jgi:TFIIF-interacting CTD phosphatase-like protein
MSIYNDIFMKKIINKKKPKNHIFLDLDSTIINSLSPDEIKLCNDNEFYPLDLFKCHKYYFKNKLEFYIFERPHLQSFLDFLFKHFNVSVFTAAQKDYATFIVDNIIEINPNRRLTYFFYSYHSDITYNYMRGLKDLNILWSIYDLDDVKPCNTIILDDNSEVFSTNKRNCIRVPEFSIILEKENTNIIQNDNLNEEQENIKIVNFSIKDDHYLYRDVFEDLKNKEKYFSDSLCPLHFPIGNNKTKNAICKLDF